MAAWGDAERDIPAAGSYDPAADVLRLQRSTGEILLPALRGRRLREWNNRYAQVTGRHPVSTHRPGPISAYGGTLSEHSAVIAELILDYDRSGALGGREHFRRTWTNDEAYLLLQLIVESTGGR